MKNELVDSGSVYRPAWPLQNLLITFYHFSPGSASLPSNLGLIYRPVQPNDASGFVIHTIMEKLYLSQRDIATLLGKLDRVRQGEVSPCTIIKNDTMHPLYPQTLRRIAVVATEAEDRYMPGVSPRLHLSRSSLMSLLAHIEETSCAPIRLGELEVFAIANDQYYVDRSATDAAPIGDLAAGFFRNRGKQNQP